MGIESEDIGAQIECATDLAATHTSSVYTHQLLHILERLFLDVCISQQHHVYIGKKIVFFFFITLGQFFGPSILLYWTIRIECQKSAGLQSPSPPISFTLAVRACTERYNKSCKHPVRA